MKTETVKLSELVKPSWHATYLLKPDMSVLAQSLNTYGWIAPLIVRKGSNEIIDGYHRYLVATLDKSLAKRLKNSAPVIYVKCGTAQAMMMHMQINRARGILRGEAVSEAVREIVLNRIYSKHDVMRMLAMSSDEFDLMMEGTLLKHYNVVNHTYSKAWVPVEAPANVTDQALVIERPPNADR